MKKWSKVLSILEILVLCIGGGLLVSSCSDDDDGSKDPSVTISVSPTSKTLYLDTASEKTTTLTATVTGSSETGVTWSSDNTDIATVSETGEVTGVAAGTTTIKATSKADTSKTASATIKVEATKPSTGGGGGSGTLWKISDYFSTLDPTDSTNGNAKKLSELGFSEAQTCGIVAMGTNVKIRSDGTGISGTITEGVTGYCQLSAGKAGGLLLTVPAGTTKITLGAKNSNKTLTICDTDGTTVLKAFNETADSNYSDHVYEHSFTAETKVYINSTGGTTNFKAIKVE